VEDKRGHVFNLFAISLRRADKSFGPAKSDWCSLSGKFTQGAKVEVLGHTEKEARAKREGERRRKVVKVAGSGLLI